MKSAAYTDRELLLSLKRLCTAKNCFRNAKPNGEVLDYYNATMKVADEELEKKGSEPDSDKVVAVVSNILNVIGNAALYFDDDSKDHRKKMIAFEGMEFDGSEVCRFLDESTKITARYQSAETKREKANLPSALMCRKVIRILKFVLLALLVIGFLIFISGFFLTEQSDPLETDDIIEKVFIWYKYSVKKDTVPVSFTEKWARFSGKVGIVTAFVAGIWLLEAVGSCILQILLRKKDKRIRQEWRDYQNLCHAFETASELMNELEW